MAEETKVGANADWMMPNADATADSVQRKSQFYKIKPDSRNKVRFMPPLANSNGEAFIRTVLHYNLKDENGKEGAMGCLLAQGESYCPACALAEHVKATRKTDKVSEATWGKVKPSERFYAQAYVEGEEDKGPVIIGMAPTIVKKLAAIGKDQREEGMPEYNHPFEGQWMVIKRTGAGLDTEYDVLQTGKTASLDKVREEWQEEFAGDLAIKVRPEAVTQESMMEALKRTFGNTYDLDEIL